ncbi:MAG: hypothetical protein H0X39_00385 [Actinobacteria bacterium]|nr:hypothetical protein [Actinomycetota bacterium]
MQYADDGLSEPERYDQQREQRAEASQVSEDGVVDLQKRAQFELQCPAATVLVLERANEDGPATLVGAQGCGQQTLYARRLRRSGWTGNYTARNAGPWMRGTERPGPAVQVSVY